MPTTTISFGFACVPDDAGYIGLFVSYFMFYPYWLIVFTWLVSMIDSRRYFFFASWAILTFLFYYLEAFSQVFMIERPEGYDWEFCRMKQYAFPDSKFVSSISYTLSVGLGLFRDHHRFGWLQGFIAYATPILYTIASVYTGYLSVGQMLANLVVSILTAAGFIVLYQEVSALP